MAESVDRVSTACAWFIGVELEPFNGFAVSRTRLPFKATAWAPFDKLTGWSTTGTKLALETCLPLLATGLAARAA